MSIELPILSALNGLRRLRSSPNERPGRTRRAHREAQQLQLPLSCKGPVAVLSPGFRLERNMRQFDPSDLPGILAFQPETIFSPVAAAISLADRKLRGKLEIPSLQFALIVLTGGDEAPLSDYDRDLLWRAFGVPVFEHLRGNNGQVIARECEVHHGLHVQEPAVAEGLSAELITSHCECGAASPRIMNRAELVNRTELKKRAAAA